MHMHMRRSHTDSLANLVVLPSLSIGDHFDDILERDLPIGTLPTFLHEVTHHWCFDSPVGLALHLLMLRARMSAIEMLSGGRAADSRLFDHVIRYEMIREFARPLSEGIALFAEHDAIPAQARILSTPMMLAGGLYGRGVGVSGDKPWDDLPIVLAAGRVSQAHVRRKAALLLEPLRCDKGGYLPGYLLVKTLWGYAYDACALCRDADFFLQYLRSHLFGDWELVGILLDETRDRWQAADDIAARFAHRLGDFLRVALTGDRPERFETAMLTQDFAKLPVRTALLELDLDYLAEEGPAVETGMRRLQEGLSAHFARWPDDGHLAAALAEDRAEMFQRMLISLGTVPAQARSRSGGDVEIVLGSRAIVIPAAEIAGGGLSDGPVLLEFLCTRIPGSLYLLVTRETTMICLRSLVGQEVPQSFRLSINTHHARTRKAQATDDLIQAALVSADLVDVRDGLVEAIHERLNAWFLPLALGRTARERLEEMTMSMRDDGLLPLLGGDKGLLIDAAAASLVIPSPYTFGSVESFHTWSRPDPVDAIRDIQTRLHGTLGLTPFLLDNDGFFLRASFI